MRTINVAITGFGSIGQHIAELLAERSERYHQLFDVDVRLVGVCGSKAGLIDHRGMSATQWNNRAGFTSGLTGTSFLQQVAADVLFEAGPTDFQTGGPALAYLRQAFSQSMHVICLSKGALVLDLASLQQAAITAGVQFRFSGATASALPTVDFLQDNLAGCQIDRVEAILTGTSNLILSEMMDTGCTYQEGLALARQLGIAEPDPSFDVDGWDTACKTIIIANAVFQAGLQLQDVPRDGISHITPDDIRDWKDRDVVPKLLGTIVRDMVQDGAQYRARVELVLLSKSHPLASVHGRMKGFRVETRDMGEFVLMGGASSPRATAAAALKDFEHILSAIPSLTADTHRN
jgi:homoserine dehydrogenase